MVHMTATTNNSGTQWACNYPTAVTAADIQLLQDTTSYVSHWAGQWALAIQYDWL